MAERIERDAGRFKKIVKGAIRKDLRRFISNGEYIGKQGQDKVSIPVRRIDLPRFRYGDKDAGGVGQGEGDQGDPINQPGDGQAEAGSDAGQHALEVELELEELAAILGEELELPNIQPRGQRNVTAVKDKYSSIRSTGPESLRHFKRTYKQALRRQIASGTYNPKRPAVVPIGDDKRYRSWKEVRKPDSNAAVIYMMDVSGSMGDEQREMVRIETFWIDTWLRKQYERVEVRYIVHDAHAGLVDRDTFFRLKESGGTKISSAYRLCTQTIENYYPPDEWNIYPFHFSDGDNWGEDNNEAVGLMREKLLPYANQFSYGQVKSMYGSGQFYKILSDQFPETEHLVLSRIDSRDGIMASIKQFLGKGR